MDHLTASPSFQFYKEAFDACNFRSQTTADIAVQRVMEGKALWLTMVDRNGETAIGLEVELPASKTAVFTILYSTGKAPAIYLRKVIATALNVLQRMGIERIYAFVHYDNPKFRKLMHFYTKLAGMSNFAVLLAAGMDDISQRFKDV